MSGIPPRRRRRRSGASGPAAAPQRMPGASASTPPCTGGAGDVGLRVVADGEDAAGAPAERREAGVVNRPVGRTALRSGLAHAIGSRRASADRAKGYRGHPPGETDKERNAEIAVVRWGAERVFAVSKR